MVLRYPAMADPPKKPFGLRADQIRPIALGRGSCFATDLITCGGRKVGFMYRERPDRDIDSGGRFMSGFESDAYMIDPDSRASLEKISPLMCPRLTSFSIRCASAFCSTALPLTASR